MKTTDTGVKSNVWLPLIPAFLFSSVVIWIVRMHPYVRPMEQFFWTSQADNAIMTDYYSYNKMRLIVFCAALALIVVLWEFLTGKLKIRKSKLYIPMAVYSAFVLLSFIFSDYKEFSWLGWNDRFEGTLVLLCYMVMLFYFINIIQSERQVRLLVTGICISIGLLGIIGLAQGLGYDVFQTVIGQKLMTPNLPLETGGTTWQAIEEAALNNETALAFKFLNNQIYQTVYNIDYVSFYLTLLVPFCGALFVRSFNRGKNEQPAVKVFLLALFGISIFNLLGSTATGGVIGVFASLVLAIPLLGKNLLRFGKPLGLLVLVAALMMAASASAWLPGIIKPLSTSDLEEDLNSSKSVDDGSSAYFGLVKPAVDYIVTAQDTIEFSINGHPLFIKIELNDSNGIRAVHLTDSEGTNIALELVEHSGKSYFLVADERFKNHLTLSFIKSDQNYYVSVNMPEISWTFSVGKNGIYYINDMQKPVALQRVAHWGFENNLRFGSWRGYIWSRTFPMLKDTFLIGHGADTFCIYFPHEDYATKYTIDYKLRKVIDKPHNMYLQAAVSTGGISLLALLALFGAYLVQSFALYRRKAFTDSFLEYAGAGIFLGVAGFLAAGLVNDSSVSVMPLFYSLLGIGFAVNYLLKSKEGV